MKNRGSKKKTLNFKNIIKRRSVDKGLVAPTLLKHSGHKNAGGKVEIGSLRLVALPILLLAY